jgi:Fe-S-cluster-containing dehydrogenase component
MDNLKSATGSAASRMAAASQSVKTPRIATLVILRSKHQRNKLQAWRKVMGEWAERAIEEEIYGERCMDCDEAPCVCIDDGDVEDDDDDEDDD